MVGTSEMSGRIATAIAAAFTGAIAALAPQGAFSVEATPQLIEDSAIRRAIDPARSLTQVCDPDAEWIRLGFASLVLSPGDSLTLVSSGGDRLVFDNARWNARTFHARALRGNCVDVRPDFSSADSHYAIDGYDAGTLSLQDSRVTVAGAGDICDDNATACGHTADVIIGIDPTSVFTAGDNAYDGGTLAQFNTYFDPNWGRFKELIAPTPGNHEYASSSDARGYFDYFNGVGNQNGPAGDRSRGYYSYDVGEWHFITLNGKKGGTIGSAQLDWLSADLAANTKPCTAAIVHFPILSRGKYTGYASMRPFWDRLYQAKADLVLVGHDHNYQRYGRMNAYKIGTTDGIRQVIAGTGGAEVYPITGTHPLLEASQSGTSGVVRLHLTPMAYSGAFVPVQGQAWSDTFSEHCNKGIMLSPDYIVGIATPTLSVVRGGSATQTVTVTSGGGFASSVRLSVSGLAKGMSYSISPNPMTPPADGQADATLILRAAGTMTWTGGLNVKVKGTSGTSVRTTTFRLMVQ